MPLLPYVHSPWHSRCVACIVCSGCARGGLPAFGCVRSQVSNFRQVHERGACLFFTARPYLAFSIAHKDTPTAGVALRATEIHHLTHRKIPKGAPEPAAGPRTRTTARHRHVTKAEPTSTRAENLVRPPPGDRTGRTRDVEFSEGTWKCRGGHPDRSLFASSLLLATSTTPRVRSTREPRAELRGAQARRSHRCVDKERHEKHGT